MQEGLTNVFKHAGTGSDPRLRLIWEAHDLLIQIDNDTHLTKAHRGQTLSVGRGLVGLRERAHAAGGRLRAGPHHKDGYRLTATFPLSRTPRSGCSSTTSSRPHRWGFVATTVPGTSGEGRGDQGKVSV